MVTLGEGGTPLVELPRLARDLGVGRLLAKLESCNPTGSYKDRIAARTMDAALRDGARGWIATSSGNGGTSFAAYGRRAGLPGILCVTETITREKLVAILALGARVVRVAGLGHDGDADRERRLFALVQEAAATHGLHVGVTAHRFNDDGMRAVDAIAGEIVDAGEAPDVAYVPAGGGGLVAAVARGFANAGAPTAVVAVQPSGCAPIARHLLGELAEPVVDRVETSISGLQVPTAPDGELAAEQIRRTGGWGATADDPAILTAQRTLSLAEGVFVEPAAACALAGLQADVRAGRIGGGTCAALILTGSALKDLATLERELEPASATSLDDVAGAVSGWVAEAIGQTSNERVVGR